MQTIYINQYQMDDGSWHHVFEERYPQSSNRRNEAVVNRRKTINLLIYEGNIHWTQKAARTISVQINNN